MDDKILGPWTCGPYNPTYVFDAHGNMVCQVECPAGMAVARARLIAAAPELYEFTEYLAWEGDEWALKIIASVNPEKHTEIIKEWEAQAAIDAAK